MNNKTLKYTKAYLADSISIKIQRLEVQRNERLTKLREQLDSVEAVITLAVKVLSGDLLKTEFAQAGNFLRETAELDKQIRNLKVILLSYTDNNNPKTMLEAEEITAEYAEYILT
jgi:hypothetical protein